MLKSLKRSSATSKKSRFIAPTVTATIQTGTEAEKVIDPAVAESEEISLCNYFNEVLCPRNLICFSDIAPRLTGGSAAALKRTLHAKGVIYPNSRNKHETMETEFFSIWYPYTFFTDKGLFKYRTYLYHAIDGTKKTAMLLNVTAKGKQFIEAVVKHHDSDAREVYKITFPEENK